MERFFSATEKEPISLTHLPSRTIVLSFRTWSGSVQRAPLSGVGTMENISSALSLIRDEDLKERGGTVAMKGGTSRKSVAVWTGAGGEASGGRSGTGEEFYSSGEVERHASSPGDVAGAVYCPASKPRRLQERLTTSAFLQVRLRV